MEGRKQIGSASASSSSSTSSFTSELFGFEDSSSSSSSTGIFGSIFAPSSKVFGRESLRSEVCANRQDSAKDAKSTVPGASWSSDESSQRIEGENQDQVSRDTSYMYQEQRVQPCTLSSSIYYGGQDIYNHPRGSPNSSATSTLKKDATEDDSEKASRGNWWKGSLYY